MTWKFHNHVYFLEDIFDIMAADSEFADYLTMESFFTAESAMAQQQNGFSVPTSQQQQTQPGDYLIPMEQYANYEQQHQQPNAILPDQNSEAGKFEFHNNNSVQYFYESNNSVQQQILQHTHQTTEYYVSPLCLMFTLVAI